MTVCSLVWKSLPIPENRLMAATALAGARKSANPVRHSFVLEARHVALTASVKICRKRNEDFLGSGNNMVGNVPSTIHAPRPTPIQWRATWGAKDITAREPSAPPPRFATLVHPLTEPRNSSGVNSAVQPLTAPAKSTMDNSASSSSAVAAARCAGESTRSVNARQIAAKAVVIRQ